MGLLEDLLLALLTLVVGYGVGLRQAEQQRIIEGRAKVLSDLFKRYVDLEEQVYLPVQIIDLPGKPNREETYRRAAESLNNLLAYHRRNTRYGCRARPLVTLTPSSKGTECTSSPSALSGRKRWGAQRRLRNG